MATASLRTFLQQLTQGMAAETLHEQTDRQLVERFLARRDEAAFEAIVRRHGALVYRVCWRVLGQHQESEDAFQATFLLLAQKLRTVRNHDSLASWLHGVAHRVALQAKGRTTRRRRHEQRATTAQVERSTDLSAEELLAVLDAELGKLPDRWRLPLILCYLEGRTQEESARQLGWSKSTLRRRLEEARAALGCRLKGRGLVWSAVLAAGLLSDCVASAALPAGLVGAAARAATLVTAGRAAASVVSPRVALLTEGMVTAMFFRKLKMAAILFLAIAGSGLGLVFAMGGLPRADAGGPVEQAVPQEQPKLDADARARPEADRDMPVRSLAGHTERVTSVAFSPDGRWIATAAWDGTARLWDAKTGKEVRRLDVPPSKNSSYKLAHLSQILFSPDSEFVVAAHQSQPYEPGVIVWNCRTGKRVRDFPAHCAAISPDGKHIACGGWGRTEASRADIQLYEFATGKLVREIHSRYSRIELLVYSRDGNTLFSYVGIPRPPLGNGLARLGEDPLEMRAWDVATGKERRTGLDGAGSGSLSAVSPDGRTLVLANELLETATGGQRVGLTDHSHGVCAVAFSPDGRTVASAGWDGTVRLWDVLSGKELGRFGKEVKRGTGGWVLSVAFSPDGRTLVSGGLDKQAHLWEVSKITGRKRAAAERSPEDLEADWKDLAGDAATGYAALRRLVLAHGSAVAFLGKQLQSIKPVDTKRVERLLAGLDSAQFAVRAQATRELQTLAEHAVPALRTALSGKPSLESRRRLEALLQRLESTSLSAETVRQIRAVEALEAIGNREARRLLEQLAAGQPELRLTDEARAAAARLARQVAP